MGRGGRGGWGGAVTPGRVCLHALVKALRAAVGQEAHCRLQASGVISAAIRLCLLKGGLSTTSGHVHGSSMAASSSWFLTLLLRQE